MPIRVFPWFAPGDYEAIKSLFPDHPDFPSSYDDWLARAYVQVHAYEELRAGNVAKPVIVNSAAFLRYLERAGLERSTFSLTSYAVALDEGYAES